MNAAPKTTFKASRSRLAWIKRRARRLALAYQIERREAVQNAALDWSHLHPVTPFTPFTPMQRIEKAAT